MFGSATPQANTWDVDTGSGGNPRPAYQNGLRGFSILLNDGTNPGRCFCELENMQHCDDSGGRMDGASGYESFAFECPGMYLDGDPWGDFSGECIICGYENKIYDSSGVDGIGTNPDLAEPHFDVCTYCPNDQDPLGPVLTEKLGVTKSGFGRNGTTCGAAYSELDTDFSCSADIATIIYLQHVVGEVMFCLKSWRLLFIEWVMIMTTVIQKFILMLGCTLQVWLCQTHFTM